MHGLCGFWEFGFFRLKAKTPCYGSVTPTETIFNSFVTKLLEQGLPVCQVFGLEHGHSQHIPVFAIGKKLMVQPAFFLEAHFAIDVDRAHVFAIDNQ